MTSLISGRARTQISDATLSPMKARACLEEEWVAKGRRHRELLRQGLHAAPPKLCSLGWGPEHIRKTTVPVMTTSWHKVSLEEKGRTENTTFWNIMEKEGPTHCPYSTDHHNCWQQETEKSRERRIRQLSYKYQRRGCSAQEDRVGRYCTHLLPWTHQNYN